MGQHICSANASHLWLSASLRCGVSQLKSLGEKQEFQGSPPLDTLHPEETGAAKLTLQSKVLDPTALYFYLLVKALNEMRL